MAKVLDVARAHFARFGYQGATIDAIAAEARVTKRTIYAWHADKAALLQACITDGAEKLARPRLTAGQDPAIVLHQYATELLEIVTRPASVGLALMFFRDGRDVPLLAATMRTAIDEHMTEPVAAYLRLRGASPAAATARAGVFVSMVMSDLQQRLLLGDALPNRKQVAAHVALVVGIFTGGAATSL